MPTDLEARLYLRRAMLAKWIHFFRSVRQTLGTCHTVSFLEKHPSWILALYSLSVVGGKWSERNLTFAVCITVALPGMLVSLTFRPSHEFRFLICASRLNGRVYTEAAEQGMKWESRNRGAFIDVGEVNESVSDGRHSGMDGCRHGNTRDSLPGKLVPLAFRPSHQFRFLICASRLNGRVGKER